MIKNNECKVEITTRNKKYYNDKNYTCKVGDIISIDISTMSEKSKNIIIAICEICKCECELSFIKYNVNFNRGGFYSCKKCSDFKRKKTMLERYEVENYSQLEIQRENARKWMSSKEFRNSSVKTQIEKNGCLFVQTDKFRENNSIKHKEIIKSKKDRGEYNCTLSLVSNKELRETAMFEKYGHTYSYHVESIKDKIQTTNLEKYNHISPFGNKEIQINLKNNIIYKSLEKEWTFNGNKYKLDLFKIYRRKVRYETDLLRKKLFNDWDGYDYYDNEYIKNNLNLNKNDNNYPSIDHKISCFYGFINGLDTSIISNISNLCITKRIINSKKSQLNEDVFKKLFNKKNLIYML